MKINQKKAFSTCLLFYVLLLHLAIVGFASESTIIVGDDPEKEIRLFDGEWLTNEFDDTEWDDLDEDLEKIYKHLDDNWNNENASEPLYDNTGEEYNNPNNYKKYSKYDYVDIIQVRVENLDKSKAKMVVEVNGDADSPDRIWFLFLWSDCTGDKDNLLFVGVFIPEGLGGSETSYYIWEQGDDDGNGTIDFDNNGHNIEMEFDSDHWNDVKDCSIKAIMMTTKEEDEDMVIDIFPGTETNAVFLWFWILLFIIILIILAFIILYFYLKNRKKKRELPKLKSQRSV